MATQDMIGILAAGAPDATIILKPKELAGLINEAMSRTFFPPSAETSPKPRQRGRMKDKGEIFASIKYYWPNVSLPKLAEVLGVTRQSIYKAMSAVEDFDESQSEVAREPQQQAPEQQPEQQAPEQQAPEQQPEQQAPEQQEPEQPIPAQQYHINFSSDNSY